jgi:RNA polymerase sigma-70 factor, ECF subfamily
MSWTYGPCSISVDRVAADQVAADQVISDIYRADWGRLLSMLVTRTRRLDLAEDALSEAFARASAKWPTTGVPTNPAGWLYTTATRLIVAAIRSEAIHGRKARLMAVGFDWVHPPTIDDSDSGSKYVDDRLTLILLCCHPALRAQDRSSLALRLVIGTSTSEIAHLFLVSHSTMAARITRAKKKIITAGIPLALHEGDTLRARLDDACRTIYLAFTAGYTPRDGPSLVRCDLSSDAVELAAVLHQLVPNAPQVQALYGLLLLQHARRNARISDGQLVTLDNQDRSQWYHDEVHVGLRLVEALSPADGYAEELRLQCLIAAEHMRATVATHTNWRAIADLYERLETLTGSPIVRLNRSVALAEAGNLFGGLALLAGLDVALPTSHRVHAVRAELESRAGNIEQAKAAYIQALELCTNEIERNHLCAHLAQLSSSIAVCHKQV